MLPKKSFFLVVNSLILVAFLKTQHEKGLNVELIRANFRYFSFTRN